MTMFRDPSTFLVNSRHHISSLSIQFHSISFHSIELICELTPRLVGYTIALMAGHSSQMGEILTANFILLVAARLLYGPWMVCSSVDESASHTHSNPSRSAEIMRRESIMTTTQLTTALCPLNVVTTRPRTRPHTITLLSSAPDTTNSTFGEKHTQVTAPVWPSNVCINCGTFICQICTLLLVATADSCESRDTSKQVAGVMFAALISARCDRDNWRNGFPFVLCFRCGGGSSLRNE